MIKIEKENQWLYDKFQEIKTCDIKELKEIRKFLTKKCDWGKDCRFMERWDFLLDEYLELKDIKRKELSFSMMRNYFWLSGKRKMEKNINFLLKIITTEKSGNIRNRAKKFVSLAIRFAGRGENDLEKWIKKVEGLISEFAPDEIPFAIENESSSIYKTLVLLWHELDLYANDEPDDFDKYFQDLEKKKIPRHYDTFDYNDEIEIEDKVINKTWEKTTDDEAKVLMQNLNNFALSRWVKLMKDYGFNTLEIEQWKSKVKKTMNKENLFAEPLNQLFPILFSAMLSKQNPNELMPDLNKYNSLVRDFQSYTNHCLWFNLNNEPISQLLISALTTAEVENGRKIKDVKEFLDFSFQIKKGGEDLLDKLENEIIENYKELFARFDEKIKDRNKKRIQDIKAEFAEMKSIFQHTADWYLIEDYWEAKQRGINKAIAVILYFIIDLNVHHNGKWLYLMEKLEDISKFGRWKNVGSMKSIRSGLDDVFTIVPDPRLFLVFQENPDFE